MKPNFDNAISSLSKILPEVRKINVLEEAEFEPFGEGGFEHERVMQTFENLRVFRPRLLVAGRSGMGQNFLGSAILQHLEGFHVQSLDLATLVGDPSRVRDAFLFCSLSFSDAIGWPQTPEAGIVQIFTEAKRHKPSIIYIPALVSWSASVGDSAKNTIKSLLDSLDPSDPILLLAVAEEPFSDIPHDIKSWFGFLRNNRVILQQPETVSL